MKTGFLPTKVGPVRHGEEKGAGSFPEKMES